MAEIISNVQLSRGIYLMKVRGQFQGKMGQFYMIRAWDKDPVLSRPLSIYSLEENSISFLYQVKGKGTTIFSKLNPKEEIKLVGPYGNGFPLVKGRVALLGGGMGAAPLYLAGQTLKQQKGLEKLDIYLGFQKRAFLKNEFNKIADRLVIDIGGLITERIEVDQYDYILTCGPDAMMQALIRKTEGSKAKVYLSIEKRMACGMGTCLVCTCKSRKGNIKVCKDGPVFRGSDIYDE